jgi:hypothetical protein
MARPGIVTRVTTAAGAGFGPVEGHWAVAIQPNGLSSQEGLAASRRGLNLCRRDIDQERLMSLLGSQQHSVSGRPMFEEPYRIEINSIRRAFPANLDAPPLLIDFANWLEGRPWGSVGCFDLVGNFSDQAFWDGSPCRSHFLRLPTGSFAGAWYPDGHKVADPPIVLLDGQWQILGPSLEGFLARLALHDLSEDSDFRPHLTGQDATDDLAAWLRRRLDVADLESLTKLPSAMPDFRGFMEKWYRDRGSYWANHPTMKALAELLVAHLPTGVNPWDQTIFDVAIVGRQYRLRSRLQPVEEATEVEPVLRGLREDMWRQNPSLGLWYSMWFGMGVNGWINPNFDYETRPTIDDAPADLVEALADLDRAPRPARWVPAWLATPES